MPMPTINLTLNVPTQAEIDDFCAAYGYKGEGTKAAFAKSVIINVVKSAIKGYRMGQARVQTDTTLKAVEDAVTNLDIS